MLAVENGIARDRQTGRRLFSLVEQDVHVPAEMSTYLAGYKNWMYRADEASPPVPVSKDED